MKSRRRLIFKISFLAIGSLILLGYASDLLSARICERRIARRIAFDLYQGREFFVLTAKSDGLISISGESLKIFRSVGANARAYTQTTTEFDGFPFSALPHQTSFWTPSSRNSGQWESFAVAGVAYGPCLRGRHSQALLGSDSHRRAHSCRDQADT